MPSVIMLSVVMLIVVASYISYYIEQAVFTKRLINTLNNLFSVPMDEFLTEGAKKIPTLAGEAIGIIFLGSAPKNTSL
jgi:hypothetical protein